MGDVKSTGKSPHASPANVAARSADIALEPPPPTGGTEPLVRDADAWQRITNELRALYPFHTQLSVPQPDTYSSIDTTFVFIPEPEDDNFRSLHVEPLLDQAGRLLDRALVDRAEADHYAVEAFKLGQELEEFVLLDQVHRDEILAGFYTLPYQRAKMDTEAELASKQFLDSATTITREIAARFDTTGGKAQEQAREQAAFSASVPYTDEEEAKKDHFYNAFGISSTKAGHAQLAARTLATEELAQYRASLEAQIASTKGAAQSADLRAKSHALLAEWANKDVTFQRERTQIARDLADRKSAAATLKHGVLNYARKRAPLIDRLQADVRDAVARLWVVREGLRDVYGHEVPLPLLGLDYLDRLVLWARSAVNWLVRFSRMDQNYVLPVSIKSLTDWGAGVATGSWTFTIPESFFPNQCHVRLRGISAAVSGAKAEDLWQVAIEAPAAGLARHLSGHTVTLDQSRVPPCRLGRVTTRSGARDPDITGISAFHNASPIGTWRVSASRVGTEGTPISTCKDIQLDLHLAVRATR